MADTKQNSLNSSMNKQSPVKMRYDINIVFAFVAVGVILLITGSGNPIWGYSWLSLALIALLFTVLTQLIMIHNSSQRKSQGFIDLLKAMWDYGTTTAPITLLLALTSWYAGQYTTYQDIIKDGNLPQEYYNFSNASITILVFEIIALYNMTKDMLVAANASESSSAKRPTKYMQFLDVLQARDDTIFYGLLMLSFIMAGFMHVILAYFVTDG